MESQELQTAVTDAEFVAHIIQLCQNEEEAARLIHSLVCVENHPSTKLCGYLTSMGLPPEDEARRLPYFVVANSIARQKVRTNGTLTFGVAFATSYKNGENNSTAQGLWGSMLACEDYSGTLISVEKYLLLAYRNEIELDYVHLLGQLRRVEVDKQSVRLEWLREFNGPQRFEVTSRRLGVTIPDNAVVRISDEGAKNPRWRGKWAEINKEEQAGLFWTAIVSNGFSSVDLSNIRNYRVRFEGLGDVIQVTWKERLEQAWAG